MTYNNIIIVVFTKLEDIERKEKRERERENREREIQKNVHKHTYNIYKGEWKPLGYNLKCEFAPMSFIIYASRHWGS